VDVFLNKSKMRRVNVKTPALDVVNVGNPFYIELGSQPFPNDYFCVRVTAKRTCSVRSFWNANLTKAMEMFKSSVSEHQAASGTQLTDYLIKCSALQSEEKLIHPTGEEPYSYTFPVDKMDIIMEQGAASSAELCTLIVSIELPKLACSEAVMNEDIVCLLTVFSGKTMRTDNNRNWTVDYQVIQTADGRLFTLKNLYASGVPNLDTGARAASFTSDSHPDLCIICHSNHVTRALLPCRHQCICGACFKRTKLCPVCRSNVTSFLVTGDESHISMPLPDEEELAEQTREGLSGMGIVELIKAIWNAS